MRYRRCAVVMVGDQVHNIDLADVVPWVRGLITGLSSCGNAAATEIGTSMIRKFEGERPDQTCCRVLCTCHDRHVVRYLGIRTMEHT